MEEAEQSLDIVFTISEAGMPQRFYNSFAGLTITRQIAWTLFAGFELALLVIWANRRTPKSRAELPSAALSFVGTVLLGFLSCVEHLRSIRPSFSLNVYLLFTTLFDIERSRTYALDPELNLVATVFASRLGVKVFLAILEAREKRKLLLPGFADYSPEATSGVYKRATFWWLNELFKKGFSNSLTVDDLFQLDKHLQANYLHHILGSAWSRCKCCPDHPILGLY
jgi:ATP-binding cassette subfamily C (CFTR/MRP) protein 1